MILSRIYILDGFENMEVVQKFIEKYHPSCEAFPPVYINTFHIISINDIPSLTGIHRCSLRVAREDGEYHTLYMMRHVDDEDVTDNDASENITHAYVLPLKESSPFQIVQRSIAENKKLFSDEGESKIIKMEVDGKIVDAEIKGCHQNYFEMCDIIDKSFSKCIHEDLLFMIDDDGSIVENKKDI